MFKTYTKEQFILAVKSACSQRQVMIQLNLKPSGGNYKTIKYLINYLNLNTDHFTNQNLKDRKLPLRRKDIEEYLVLGSSIQSNKLRKYLIDSKLKEEQCEICKLTLWLNNKIPLELDHINGNNKDNRLQNLRIICPNCHAQTPTYRGKNIKRGTRYQTRTDTP